MTEKKEHPYAHVLRWLAAGESVQWENDRNQWADKSTSDILLLLVRESTSDKFRIKPKTIRIGKYDVAEPMKEAPVEGTAYWRITSMTTNGVDDYTWDGSDVDRNLLTSGSIWLNKDDALLAAKAIKELLTGQ